MHRMSLTALCLSTLCLSALFLSACAGGRREAATFRQPEAPIWSAAAFIPAQVTGQWQQVAAFAAGPGEAVGAGQSR